MVIRKSKFAKKEISTLEEVIDKIKGKDFDILLTVGAGNIDTLYDGLLEWFEQR